MKSLIKNTFCYLSLLLISNCIPYAQLQSQTLGGLAGSPMRMGFGARGIAMGNAMISVNEGEILSYYNPALSPFSSFATASVAYGILSLDRRLNFLSYTKSIKPNAGFAISIINAGVSNIDGRNRDGIHTEYYSTSENSFILSFGLKPAPRFSIGASVKILYFILFEDMKSTTAALDIGATYLLTDEFTLGAVFQDLKGKYHWNSTKLYGTLGRDFYDYFPLRKRIGISWIPKDYPFILANEFESIGSETFLRVGAEFIIYDGFNLRGGVDQIALKSDLPAKPAFGFSFETSTGGLIPIFQYTYVFEPYCTSGIHILSLSLKL